MDSAAPPVSTETFGHAQAAAPEPRPADPSVPRRRLLRGSVLAAAVIFIAAIWGGVFALVAHDRSQGNAQADRDANNLALAFEEQIRRQLLAVDQSLRIMAADWARDPAGFSLTSWHPRLAALLDITSQSFITDAEGRILASTLPGPVAGLSAADRDYFRAQAARETGQVFISSPLGGRVSGRWALNISRRLSWPDGSFAGVIAIAFDAGALVQVYRRADIGALGLLALVGADGRVRAAVAPEALDSGQDISWSPLFRALAGAPTGTWVGQATDQSPARRHAFNRVGELPLHVVVGIAESDIAAAYTDREVNTVIVAAAISIAIGLLALLLIREIGRGERREAELATQRSELRTANAGLREAVTRADEKTALLETTLGSMSDGVSVVDGELRLVAWNRRFVDLSGVPAGILRPGLGMAEILRAQARAGEFGLVDVEAEVARRMAQSWGPDFISRTEREKPDGRVMELRRASLPGGGFVTLYIDITERRRVAAAERAAREAAENASAAKSAVVAFVSHEVRTPLGAMLGAIELLQKAQRLEDVAQLAAAAADGGQTLLTLVNDLLDLSRIEAGRLLLDQGPFDLHGALNAVSGLFAAQAAAGGASIALTLAPDLPRHVIGDARRLRQVVGNLVSNALKFGGAAPVEVEAVPEAGRVMIRVRDHGPGIPPAEADKLFEPFERLETGKGVPGTGLGLAICRRLVGLMGGDIGFADAQGGGTVFWIRLPLPATAAPAAPVAAVPAGRTLRLLLADDSPAGQRVAAALLGQHGHLVEIVSDGEAAVARATAADYDLILLDVHMPRLDGPGAARRIRALPGSRGRVPLVALTGSVMGNDRDRLIAAGMDEVLLKPVPTPLLQATLARLAPATAAEPTGPSPFDATALAALEKSLGAEVTRELVEACILEIRGRLPALLDAPDAAARGAEAHAMAGAASSHALAPLAATLHRIEAASRRGEDEEAARLAAGVGAALDEAAAALAARSPAA